MCVSTFLDFEYICLPRLPTDMLTRPPRCMAEHPKKQGVSVAGPVPFSRRNGCFFLCVHGCQGGGGACAGQGECEHRRS